MIPTLWVGVTFDAFADRIAAGEPFKLEALETLRPQLNALASFSTKARPCSLRGAALIELRLAELSLANSASINDNKQVVRADAAIRSALAVLPSDSFLWFALFWLEKEGGGYHASLLPLLKRSYDLGPHEGWVAIHRNAEAVPLLPLLPPEMQSLVVEEFKNLASQGYADAAADIVTGRGWGHRDILLAAMAATPLETRRAFSEAIYNRDSPGDVEVPGVKSRKPRPWSFQMPGITPRQEVP